MGRGRVRSDAGRVNPVADEALDQPATAADVQDARARSNRPEEHSVEPTPRSIIGHARRVPSLAEYASAAWARGPRP
jgi:hypothetical protein